MKQSLQLRLSQHLALTPQLQQSIRLLLLSTVELNQEVEAALQTNPLLERIDQDEDAGTSGVPAASHDSAATAGEAAANYPGDSFADAAEEPYSGYWEESGTSGNEDDEYLFQEAYMPTLREHLLEQIKLLPLSERDLGLTALLVDAINEDGYLEQSLEELAEILPAELEIDPLELQTALRYVQHLEPLGVGARNLVECLSLQLEALPEDTPYRALALELVQRHLTELATRDYTRLCRLLGCDEYTLRALLRLIIQLNPRPGAKFSRIGADQYIQHEVVVRKVRGVWVACLNQEAMPRLRINQMYADILKRNRDSSTQHLMSQMQEAKWLIKNIQQRFSTILRVSQAIVDRQRNFFEHGEIAMRPLVLREIADAVGLHESTISRVTSRKYMLTPRGIFELKHFFGSHVATEDGATCSATAIRALIKQLIAEESPKKPLSDSQIAEILGKQGIVVARRTIAKYRELLQLPPASQRKGL